MHHEIEDFILIELDPLSNRLWQVGKVDSDTAYVRRVLLEPGISILADDVVLSSFVSIWYVVELVLVHRVSQYVIVVNVAHTATL